ncbi:MAG: methyltransferase domain-containing protein [Planctomycetota bacterium]
MSLKERHRVDELMDDPNLDPDKHRKALEGLRRLNRVSGVSGFLYRLLRKRSAQMNCSASRPIRLLDIASGSAEQPIEWMSRAKKDGWNLDITTTDVSPTAIEVQNEASRAAGVSINAVQWNCIDSPVPSHWTTFDFVHCNLFFHHLEPAEASGLLRTMMSVCHGWVVVCDLERSWPNLAMVNFAARTLSRSPIVHFDASASVRGAYTTDEFRKLAHQALDWDIDVRRLFPCRFVATVPASTVRAAEPANALAFA